jgi:WD40 repeat protein
MGKTYPDSDWLRIYNANTGALFKSIRPFTDYTAATAMSPDGKYIAAGNKSVRVYSFPQGTLIKKFGIVPSKSYEHLYSLCFTPDNQQVIAGDSAGRAKFFYFRTGKLDRCLIDLKANTKDVLGRTYKYKDVNGNWVKVTVPFCQCSPLPNGAVCTCDTVPGSYCSCDDYHCGCVGDCGCHGVHVYWYPN